MRERSKLASLCVLGMFLGVLASANIEGKDTYWVDQMIRYIPALATTAMATYTQKHTCIVV